MNYPRLSALTAISLLWANMAANAAATPLTPTEQLGKKLFFDTSLSANGTQSCASCHAPETGFTGPDATTNRGGAVYEGALPDRFGNRKPPTSAYAGDSPTLHYDETQKEWFGGMFWDGRASGGVLGDPLAEQAQGPFLNPLEQAIDNSRSLCTKVRASNYAALFVAVWGAGSLDCDTDSNGAYEKIGRSVAAYERSAEVTPFSSKFDLFWETARKARKDVTKIRCGTGGGMMGCAGSGTNGWAGYRNLGLTDAELQGLALFNDPVRGNCSSCHSLKAGSDGYPLFTNFGYENIGIPKNPANPFYTMPAEWNPDGAAWIDYGLGGYLKSAGHEAAIYGPQMGKQKVPTLRNVDLRPYQGFVKAYGHNGYFKSLDAIVLFYHWRAAMDAGMGGGGMGGGGMGGSGMTGMFPPPEVNQNRARLSMFPRIQVGNIVLFLKTLSDGYSLR